MIPKKIHYCWMSGEPYPELVKKCISSWMKIMPDYEIIEWNSNNFDYRNNRYALEAYETRKWAFVSDYVRLKVLYDYGGIYLDSDIEVFKKFDKLLNEKAFTGFEDESNIGAWLLASEKGNPIFKAFLDEYSNRRFLLEDGTMDLTPNPIILTGILENFGFQRNGKLQKLDNIVIYPKDYFCPKDFKTGKIKITSNTFCIHYFNGGWLPWGQRVKHCVLKFLFDCFGVYFTNKLLTIYKKVAR